MKLLILRPRRIIFAVGLLAAAATILLRNGSGGETAAGAVRLPIIMYHSVLRDEARSGDYVITPAEFERDLQYLEEKGYESVFVRDLVNFIDKKTALPKKPVMLTFDDGYYNNEVYVLPLLEKYNQRAVISIVGKYTEDFSENPDENPNYAYLSWKNANELLKSGRIEIGNHSYNMHSLIGRRGTGKAYGEDPEDYVAALSADLTKMQNLCKSNTGAIPEVFVYPFGNVSPESYDAVKACGFAASMSCEEGINRLTGEREELYLLKRCIRTSKRSVKNILEDFT